ncbi:MAG: M1 family metallopeptidase [Chitinophagaceae bacterium]
MRIFIPLLLLFPCISFGQHYWQQRTDYTLEVTLNDREHTLDGTVKILYTNASPDTLTYIWFHLWPNAYKNDKTAFSDQLLQLDRTDFYFSKPQDKGYINRLDFKVNGITAQTHDHPSFIDVVRIELPSPLLPGTSIDISTPFHVKIPAYTSRLGHVGQQYLITQWYPKPAVYDKEGWHPMPYLEQGEFYAEFGNFDVKIHLPEDYMVAGGGTLLNNPVVAAAPEMEQVKKTVKQQQKALPSSVKKTDPDTVITASSAQLNTWHFQLENTSDFAWFAGKKWIREEEHIILPSGKNVTLQVYFQPWVADQWKQAMRYAERAIRFYSGYLGDYPYPTFSVVAAPGKRFTGMEYPAITLISSEKDSALLEQVIAHEAGHNWFQAAIGSNERAHPWMDEGLNTWVEQQYLDTFNVIKKDKKGIYQHEKFLLNQLINAKLDQPIATPAEQLNGINYLLITYKKTGQWLNAIQKEVGEQAMQKAFRKYYEAWKFKHPTPSDLKETLETSTGKGLKTYFDLLDKKGAIPSHDSTGRKRIKLTGFFNQKNTDSIQYISLAPFLAHKPNDGLMTGMLLHNYQLPLPKFRFLAASVYGTQSRQWHGLAKAAFHQYRDAPLKEWSAGISYSTFSNFRYQEGNEKIYLRVHKFMPELTLKFGTGNPLDKIEKSIRFRHYSFREESLLFQRQIIGNDTSFVPGRATSSRYLNQVSFQLENNRVLYPYTASLVLEQMQDLWKAGFTGTYFFNYPTLKKQGLQARFFAGKIIYPGEVSLSKRFRNSRYHLNMTGPKGDEDYTYSNYFIGRNDFEGFRSQQIMVRDGAFKVRTDLLSSKVGKTDDWLAALNLVTDVPPKLNPLQVLPVKIPLKLFLDIGTYAEAWDPQTPESEARFLYDAGLQFSLFREALNIYVPLFYSKVYRDYFNSTLGDKKFWKTISFSIQLDALQPRKWMPGIGL